MVASCDGVMSWEPFTFIEPLTFFAVDLEILFDKSLSNVDFPLPEGPNMTLSWHAANSAETLSSRVSG